MLRAAALSLAGLLALSPGAHAIVLDWNSVVWTPGALSSSYDIDPNVAGNDITVTFTGDTGGFAVDPASGFLTPAITSTLQGGGAPGDVSLEMATQMVPPNSITVTVTFSPQYHMGVEGVSFTLFDIDDGDKRDVVNNISATGIGGAPNYAATISDLGSSVTVTGNGFSQQIRGTADSPDTGPSSGNGNATISFGTNPIQSFTFTFDGTTAGPKLQLIGISDISFTPVPEINPVGVACSVCLAAILLWKRRSRSRNDI